MDNDIKTWLYDILNAIMEIESFFDDSAKEFVNYQTDYEPSVPLKEILK